VKSLKYNLHDQATFILTYIKAIIVEWNIQYQNMKCGRRVMTAINPMKAGLTLGSLCGGWHLCWSLLVATGWAQPFIDFIFWMHFIKPVYVIGPFNFVTAIALIGMTAIMGFLVGYLFSLLWNRLHQN
jgi:hypothetical protein